MNPLGSKMTPGFSSKGMEEGCAALGSHSIRPMNSSHVSSKLPQLFNSAQAEQSLLRSSGQVDEHLSPSLFAHIHMNDRGLIGSELEGHVFTTSMEFASQELSRLSSGEYQIGLNPQELHEAKTLQRELGSSKQTLERLYQINAMPPEEATRAIAALQRELMSQINRLEKGERLLLPGGWTGSPGGHAMLYEVERGHDGNLSFHLYNSGDGLQYHPSRKDDSKRLCHLQWNLGAPASAQATLGRILPQLLMLRSKGKSSGESSGCEQLYKSILPDLERSASRQIPLPGDPCWMNPQRSGICTWQSIQVLERARLPQAQKRLNLCTKVRTYRQFIGSHNGREMQSNVRHVASFAFNHLGSKLQAYGLSQELIKAPNIHITQGPLTPTMNRTSALHTLAYADPESMEHVSPSLENRVHLPDRPTQFIDFIRFTGSAFKRDEEESKPPHKTSFLKGLFDTPVWLIRRLLKDLMGLNSTRH